MPNKIKITNASEHNLKSLNVEIPHNSLTVITGVSGSGKSSLAYDVIFKESQRRFLESFSSFSRQFIGKLSRPKVEKITGLKPALSIDQRTVSYNPRSTVGTMSQISDYLRMLFAKKGKVFCYNCNEEIKESKPEEIRNIILEKYAGQKIDLYASIVEGHTGSYEAKINDLKSKGILKLIVDGEIYKSIDKINIDKNIRHTIWAFEGSVEVSKNQNLEIILNKTFEDGNGVIKIISESIEERIALKNYCTNCNTEIPEIGSRLFSFNSKYGACPGCNGLGLKERIDPELVLADKSKTLREGALVPTTPTGYIVYSQVTVDALNEVCEAHGFDVETPWNELTEEQQNVIWYGSKKVQIPFGKHSLESRLKWSGITAKPRELGYYKGMLPIMEEILRRDRNDNILRFVSSITCPECEGTRLRKEARSIYIKEKNITEICAMSISNVKHFLYQIDTDNISEKIISRLINRIENLQELGLGYLTIDRESTTLSGGEAQRIRLATQVGTGLRGVLYILDEPSVGLHQRDNNRLINLLKKLRNNGNTIIVVEHDEETIREADHIVDIGPGAGINGGELLFSGTPKELLNSKEHRSKTKKYLSNEETIKRVPGQRKLSDSLIITGATQHNLKNINVEFKLGALNVVTGVSGAGKSTLVHDVLGGSIKNNLSKVAVNAGACRGVDGMEKIKKIIEIDQSPIGKTPRSNPATYTKLFDLIRDLFASLAESNKRGYKKGRFSFNNKGGRCEKCEGAGIIEIGMHFLANSEIVCEECNGKRFNTETLEIEYKNKNIFEVLELSIEEAKVFFDGEAKIEKILATMINLGIGYLKLGQPSTTLSGGEAQRIKLASELHKSSTGKTLYILDEPTTGLHFADIKVLLKSLNQLVDKGNTVIVIEHNIDLIKTADWIIDLGPEGGEEGGNVVAIGDLKELITSTKSYTAKALRNQEAVCNSVKQEISLEDQIILKGANVNNLKNIDVKIPLNQMTVITGVSGSGKSSIAFDTLYTEARNRFTESFSPNARRMIGKVKESRVEECFGITPAIAVNQKITNANPRSTVGTTTDLFDYYRLLFSRLGVDKKTGKRTQLSASEFSFNNPSFACDKCKGMGVEISALPELIVTDPYKSLLDGALNGTKTGKFYGDVYGQYVATLKQVGAELEYNFTNPFYKLSKEEIGTAMYGTGNKVFDVEWKFKRKDRDGVHKLKTKWVGFINLINDEYQRKHGSKRGETLEKLVTEISCNKCNGKRYKEEILNVEVAENDIDNLANKTISESIKFFNDFLHSATENEIQIANNLIKDILKELNSINNLGLSYIAVNRNTSTLSGGELQRLKLANQLNAELSGVTYVLDEPTIGLHPRDTEKLIEHLKKIQDNGNTMVIVEHDEDIIRNSDYLIDVGPAAGINGGEIIAEGKTNDVLNLKESITARTLNRLLLFQKERKIEEYLIIKKANANNLKNIELKIPLNNLVTVTGVSGSGKSSLVFDVIGKSLLVKKYQNCKEISHPEKINLININQIPIGTTPLSNVLTYTGVFDKIRKIFSNTEDAKAREFGEKYFSFNTKGGRCEECSGMGIKKTGMDFLADIWTTCEVCNGKRYKEEILEVKFNGYNIFEILSLSVEKAIEVFAFDQSLNFCFNILNDIGLGYMCLGQGTNTMSGGETQRLKLAKELIKSTDKNNLYIFDEPTTGLHKKDVEKLLILFNKLLDEGHSIIVVEHNLDIINNSNWIIDLGPKAGDEGGYIVFEGTPNEIINCKKSFTGKALKKHL